MSVAPEVLTVPPSAVPATRARTRKALVDERLELTDQELHLSREQYDLEQARIVAEISTKKRDKAAYILARDVSNSYSSLEMGRLTPLLQLIMQPPSFRT